MNTHPTRRLRTGDDGSLLLAIMFTMMIAALTLAIMVSVMSGLNKSKNSRDFSIAQQAADIAFADAVMYANMGYFNNAANGATQANHGAVGNVNWTWTATHTGANQWDVTVHTQGKSIDRDFAATITGTRVLAGVRTDTNGDGIRDSLRYDADTRGQYFSFGFYGRDRWASTGVGAEIDGYNGRFGTVGDGGTQRMELGATKVDQINLFNYRPDDTLATRCNGTACNTAFVKTYSKKVYSRVSETATAECQNNLQPTWYASNGQPLQAGACYNEIRFNANTTANLSGTVYSSNGVYVSPGVQVNANRATANAPSKHLQIVVTNGGTVDLGAGAIFAGAVYNPSGPCVVNSGDSAATATMWLGAATCATFDVTGAARLRYDGELVAMRDSTQANTGHAVWTLNNFQTID